MKSRYILILLISIILSACVSEQVSITHNSNSSPTEIDHDTYLLLAVETNITLYKLYIHGEKSFYLTEKDLQKGSNYILIPLPPGKYSIEKIKEDDLLSYSLHDKDKYWTFELKKGRINYVGHLISYSSMLQVNVSLKNYSSVALEYIEDEFPSLLSTIDLHYSGPGEDSFLEKGREVVK